MNLLAALSTFSKALQVGGQLTNPQSWSSVASATASASILATALVGLSAAAGYPIADGIAQPAALGIATILGVAGQVIHVASNPNAGIKAA